MDSELPHCTVCLKPLAAGWRCPEHRDPAPSAPPPSVPEPH